MLHLWTSSQRRNVQTNFLQPPSSFSSFTNHLISFTCPPFLLKLASLSCQLSGLPSSPDLCLSLHLALAVPLTPTVGPLPLLDEVTGWWTFVFLIFHFSTTLLVHLLVTCLVLFPLNLNLYNCCENMQLHKFTYQFIANQSRKLFLPVPCFNLV